MVTYTGDPMTRHSSYTRQPLPPRQEDVERWQAFCAALPALIEEIRRSECQDAVCPTCGCSAHSPERRCSQCQVVKPLTHFNRDRRLPHGRIYQCKTCRRPERRRRYREEKRDKFQTVLWRNAS